MHPENRSLPLPTLFRALPASASGELWLSGMPGRGDSWTRFLEEARRARLDLVVCLTPRHEVESGSPEYAAASAAGTLPFEWMHLPMRNLGLPEQRQVFEAAVAAIAARTQGGAHVLLHCMAGIGRTGTIAACVLKQLGLPTDEALRRVRAAGSDPESALQSGLVDRFGRRAPA